MHHKSQRIWDSIESTHTILLASGLLTKDEILEVLEIDRNHCAGSHLRTLADDHVRGHEHRLGRKVAKFVACKTEEPMA